MKVRCEISVMKDDNPSSDEVVVLERVGALLKITLGGNTAVVDLIELREAAIAVQRGRFEE